jgi:hypothetical protein
VLFLKQGGQGRGLVAIGYAATPCFVGDDWRNKGSRASRQYYLWVRFSAFVDPRKELLLSDHEICNILRRDKLHHYSSGSFLKAQAEDLDKLWDLALSAAKERGALQSLEAIRAPKDPLAGDNTLTGQGMAKALSELSFTKSEKQLLLALYQSENHSGTREEIAKAGDTEESEAKRGFFDAGKKIAKHLSLSPLPATETEPSLSLDHILVEEKWDENQFVWIVRSEVVYAIRKSWMEFVVPFDEPAGGYKRKSALELSESDKQRCLLAHNFRCWQCGFDARREYPGIPTGFLEVRINPTRVATPEPGLIDPERDLVPLCGRCLIQMESSEA